MSISKRFAWLERLRKPLSKVPSSIYAIVVLVVFFSLVCRKNTFLTFSNFMNIVEQTIILAIISIGSFMVIVSQGIDLSLGANMSLSGLVAATMVYRFQWPVLLAYVAGICVGMLIGMFNGLVISRNKVAPFIITLGTMNIAKSLSLIISNSQTIPASSPAFRWIGSTLLFGVVPAGILVLLAVYTVFSYITRKRKFGTHLFAVGGNEAATVLSGINVKRVKFITYTLLGLLAAIAGILLASRLGAANPAQGEGFEFYGIAATIAGGTSMKGGRGSVWRTLSGAFIISILRNGLNMAGLPSSSQMIALGLVIVGVVTVDTVSSNRRKG